MPLSGYPRGRIVFQKGNASRPHQLPQPADVRRRKRFLPNEEAVPLLENPPQQKNSGYEEKMRILDWLQHLIALALSLKIHLGCE
jgi:hypothetical protein